MEQYSDPRKYKMEKQINISYLDFFFIFSFFYLLEDGQLSSMETDQASTGPTSVNTDNISTSRLSLITYL